MNPLWALARAGITSAVRSRLNDRSRSGNSGGASHLLAAAVLSALILAAPGFFVVLLLAGLSPAGP